MELKYLIAGVVYLGMSCLMARKMEKSGRDYDTFYAVFAVLYGILGVGSLVAFIISV